MNKAKIVFGLGVLIVLAAWTLLRKAWVATETREQHKSPVMTELQYQIGQQRMLREKKESLNEEIKNLDIQLIKVNTTVTLLTYTGLNYMGEGLE